MAENEKEEKGRLFSSWKEIADYLKCDARTCLRWEKSRGLPIHRLDGGPKSRVFAYKDELDDWVKGKNGTAREPTAGEEPGGTDTSKTRLPPEFLGRFARRYLVVAIPLLVAVGGMAYFLLRPSPHFSEPADFRIDGSELVILARNGKELWRYDTHIDDLCGDAAFRRHFQFKRATDWPWLMIRDINRDGRAEVLFSPQPDDNRGVSTLLCFDHLGRQLWKFLPGRELWCGTRQYSDEYHIRGFETVDIDGTGETQIIVDSSQPPNWLAQLAVLDAKGGKLGEFWNSGHIADVAVADLDGDGRKELLACGVNNEYQKGCLIVFDPHRMDGCSPQAQDEFTCRGLQRGTEKYYMIFPRTDADLLAYPIEAVEQITLESPGILSLTTNVADLIFILSFKMTVEDVTFSHHFMQLHKDAVEAGKVHSDITDPRYKEALLKGILYYDGRTWTTRPTPVVDRPASAS